MPWTMVYVCILYCMQVLDTTEPPAWAMAGEDRRRSRRGVRVSARSGMRVPCLTNRFWNSRQRAGHSLHEISYRACFKPELPGYFIRKLTAPGDAVLDCFMGRGTAVLEAALQGREAWGNDLNPLGRMLVEPRLAPPTQEEVSARLRAIDFDRKEPQPKDLRVFYHRRTLGQICALRGWLLEREAAGELDGVDRWIRMVGLNRLTGHSAGFFSVYTLPPNQAVTVEAQRRINRRRGQQPPERDVPALILKKSRNLLRQCVADPGVRPSAPSAGRRLLTGEARAMTAVPDGHIDLVVTSPPFLDTVDYRADNWLRCWFAGIDAEGLPIRGLRSLDAWVDAMSAVFGELHRVLKPGGHIAFEVGEIRKGTLDLEDYVLEIGLEQGLRPLVVLRHEHAFTKTAHCWGVSNGKGGTNSHRVVVFRKEG